MLAHTLSLRAIAHTHSPRLARRSGHSKGAPSPVVAYPNCSGPLLCSKLTRRACTRRVVADAISGWLLPGSVTAGWLRDKVAARVEDRC
eukprot:1309630-Rhodomonas_salina.3